MANCGNKKQVFKTSEASTKARMRTLGIIDQYLNVLDYNKFMSFVNEWTMFAKVKRGVDMGPLFIANDNTGRAIPNARAFHMIDYKKGIRYKDNEYLWSTPKYQSLTEYKGIKATENTIRDLAATMSERIGIKYKIINDKLAEFKGRIAEDGTAIINLAHATLDTPIHEIVAHPMIAAIKGKVLSEDEWGQALMADQLPFEETEHPSHEGYLKYVAWKTNGETLYNNLLKELEYGRGKEVLDRIKRDYVNKVKYTDVNRDDYEIEETTFKDKETGKFLYHIKHKSNPYDNTFPTLYKTREEVQEAYSNMHAGNPYSLEEQQEEAIVELLGMYTAERLDATNDKSLIGMLKELLAKIHDFIRNLLSQREIEITKLPNNLTVGDIADVLAYSNSKLVLPGYKVKYTTPDNLYFETYAEASAHIAQLARAAQDIDLNAVSLDLELSEEEQARINKLNNEIESLKERLNSADYLVAKRAQLAVLRNELEKLTSKPIVFHKQEPNLSRDVANKYGFKDYDYVRVESTYSRPEIYDTTNFSYDSYTEHRKVLGNNYEGYYIHGYNTVLGKPETKILPITKEQAEEIWNNSPEDKHEARDKQQIYQLKGRINYVESDGDINSIISSIRYEIAQIEGGDDQSIKGFIRNNAQYEHARDIIERWKEINDIEYNPDEIYSRSQEFVSVLGAYSTFDLKLLLQNIILHIEDNQKAGGEFVVSAFTRPKGRKLNHIENRGENVRFKIYPKPEDIKWAANTDVYSGSVWNAGKQFGKGKQSETVGVSYSKYPGLSNLINIQPNLAYIVDNLAHTHNELGIALTGTNFRIEYDEGVDKSVKTLVNKVNALLDSRYGKIKEPKEFPSMGTGYRIEGYHETFSTEKKAKDVLHDLKMTEYGFKYGDVYTVNSGISPTKTNNDIKVSIRNIKDEVLGTQYERYGNTPNLSTIEADYKDGKLSKEHYEKLKKVHESLPKRQAMVNAKVSALKQAARKYPRGLIRSEVLLESAWYAYSGVEEEDLPWQKIPTETKPVEMHQNESKTNEKPNKQLDDAVKTFLEGIGVAIHNVAILKTAKGDVSTSAAIARITERILDIAQGREAIDTLPEEAGHFFVALLGKDSVLYKAMDSLIVNTPEYKQAKIDYNELYKGDDRLIREEAMGQIIANELVKMAKSGELNKKNTELTKVQSLIKRIWDWIVSKFSKGSKQVFEDTVNPFRDVAERIVNNNTQGLDWKNTVDESNTISSRQPVEMHQINKAKSQAEIRSKFDHDNKTLEIRTISKDLLPKNIAKLVPSNETTVDRYFDLDTGQMIPGRFTDLVQRYFQATVGKGMADAINDTPDNKLKLATGTRVHAAMEGLVVFYAKRNKSGLINIKHLSEHELYNATLEDLLGLAGLQNTPHVFKVLAESAKALVNQIADQQKEIDPKGTADVFVEQRIQNRLEKTAGTIDMLAVYSDSTASIFDYKTVHTGMGTVVEERDADGRKVYRIIKSPIADKKINSFDLQIGAYKRTLGKEYGIKEVRHTRIIPIAIKMQARSKKNGGKTGNWLTGFVEDIQVGTSMSEHLHQIPVAEELSGVASTDEFIAKLRNDIVRLENKLKGAKAKDKAQLQERIASKRKEIIDILTKHDIRQTLIDIGGLVSFLAGKDGMSGALGEELKTLNGRVNLSHISIADLLSYRQEINVYTKLEDYLSDPLEKLRNSTNEADREYAEEAAKLIPAFRRNLELLLESIDERIIQRRDELEEHYEVYGSERGKITNSLFGRLSEIRYKEFEIFSAMLSRAQTKYRFKMELVLADIKAKENDVKEWAKSHGMSLHTALNKLINPKTMNMYGRYSAEFWKNYEEAIAEKDVDWLQNHRQLRADYEDVYKRAEESYLNYLNTQVNTALGYKEDAVKFYIANKMEAWRSTHDMSRPEAWLNQESLNRYTEFKPETLTGSNVSPEYAFIQANKPLLAFYEMIEEYNAKARDILGASKKDIPSNFLPWIRKNILDQITQGQFSPKVAWAEMINSLDYREDDTQFGQLDENNKPIKTVPIYFVKPLRNPDGSIAYNAKTTDIAHSLYTFMQMATNHAVMSEIEADVNALLQSVVANDDGEVMRNTSGNKMMNKAGQYLKDTTKSPKTSTELFELFRDYYLYGIHDRVPGTTKTVLGAKVNSTKLLKKLNNYLSAKVLGFAVLPGAAAFTAGMVGLKAEATKGVWFNDEDLSKALKFRVGTDTHKLAIAINRMFEAHQEDMTYYKGKQLYSQRSSKIFSMDNLFYHLRKPDEVLDDVTTLAMANKWGFRKDGTLARIDKIRNGDSNHPAEPDAKTILEAASLDKDGNLFIEGLSNNGYTDFRMLIKRVGSGIKGNMSEEDVMAFKTNIYWDTLMKFKNWMPGFFNERFGKIKFDRKYDIFEGGRYGQMISAYNREAEQGIGEWLGKIVVPTLGSMIKDIIVFGNNKHGFHFNKVRAQAMYEEYLLQNGLSYEDASFEAFYEMKQGQTKATLTEVRALLIMMSIVLALGADWDDDKEKNYNELWATRQLYKFINRAITEMSAGYSPTQFVALIQSGIPLASLGVDIVNALSNTVDTGRDILVGQNQKNDKTPAGYYTFGFVPGFRQLNRIVEFYELNDPNIQKPKDE